MISRHKVSHMPTLRSCLALLSVSFLVACGGSVSEEGGTGGAAGGGGSSGSGGAPGKDCVYQGKTYPPFTSWTASDGCNTCSCQPGGEVSCTLKDCAGTCSYGGKVYQAGESFPAGDGCNTCSCMGGGQVACTAAYCGATCTYGGKQYAAGDTFPALDGCNKCTCTDQGVTCTEIACACDPAKEWWRSYVGKSPEECMTIKYACPANTTSFANPCGCGCEQDASCPEFIDCMPPAPDCDKWKAKCPFSGVAY